MLFIFEKKTGNILCLPNSIFGQKSESLNYDAAWNGLEKVLWHNLIIIHSIHIANQATQLDSLCKIEFKWVLIKSMKCYFETESIDPNSTFNPLFSFLTCMTLYNRFPSNSGHIDQIPNILIHYIGKQINRFSASFDVIYENRYNP